MFRVGVVDKACVAMSEAREWLPGTPTSATRGSFLRLIVSRAKSGKKSHRPAPRGPYRPIQPSHTAAIAATSMVSAADVAAVKGCSERLRRSRGGSSHATRFRVGDDGGRVLRLGRLRDPGGRRDLQPCHRPVLGGGGCLAVAVGRVQRAFLEQPVPKAVVRRVDAIGRRPLTSSWRGMDTGGTSCASRACLEQTGHDA